MPRFAAALAALGLAAGACAPEQVMVHYGDTPDALMFSWATFCNDQDSVVKYGPSASLGKAVNGTAVTYKWSGYTAPWIHHTNVTGLPAGTVIYYSVGGAVSGFSPVASISSLPGVSIATPMKFAIVGDPGQTDNSASTFQHVLAAQPPNQAMVIVGDLSYADSDETRWDSWGNLVTSVASTIPMMTEKGNHEVEQNSDPFIAYETRFWMPQIYPGTPNQKRASWSSFRAGGVHFLLLDQYVTFASGSEQYTWVKAELASVDRSVTPFVVVSFHAPYMNSNKGHQGDGDAMQAALEDTFFKAGVDIIFSGHVHAYERCYRSYQKQRNPAGPYYVTIGDGGNREGLYTTWLSPQPAWSAFRMSTYGHGELEVVNATTMHWTWHQNSDLEPTVADELWIVRNGEADRNDPQVTLQGQLRA